MAEAFDGRILIDTHIVTDGLNSDISAIEKRLHEITSGKGRSGRKTASIGSTEYADVARQLREAEEEAGRLQKKFDDLVAKEERFIATGGDQKSRTLKGYDYDIEKTLQAMTQNDAKIASLRDRYAELEQAAQRAAEAEYRAGNKAGQSESAAGAIEETTQAENQQTSATEQLTAAISGMARQTSNATAQTQSLGKGARSTSGGFKSLFRMILKYGIGIRSVYMLFRKFRQAVIEGFKNLSQVDAQTNASVSTLKSNLSLLKNSFAAAFAPVLTAVAPILNKLIRMIVTAINYVGMFFAALSGASSYRPAIYAYEDYAESLDNTAGAAADAAKNLSGLDEMNIWQDASGGGGGAGTGPSEMWGDEEAIPSNIANIAEKVKSIFSAVYDAVAPVIKDLWNMLTFEADDVLFNWDNLSSEDILEKIVAGFGLLFGAIAGFSITHSVKGLVIGAVIGLALTILLNGVTFNDDGKISKKEIARLIAGALNAISGAIIGFSIGGAKGAAIGAVVGISLTVLIKSIEFNADPIKNTKIQNALFGALTTAFSTIAGVTIGAKVGGGYGALIGGAIGLTVGLVVTLVAWQDTPMYALTDAQKDLIDAVRQTSAAYAELNSSLDTNATHIHDNYKRVQDLWGELQTLCDETGHVSDGYENRVDVILGLLNDALGTEYERNGDIITQYRTMQDEIDGLIAKQKAMALFSAWGPSYEDALQGRDTALANLKIAKADLDAAWDKYESLYSPDPLEGETNAAAEEYWKTVYLPLEQTYEEAEQTARSYYATIDRYEKAQMAILAGDYETATRLLESYTAYRWMNMEEGHQYTEQELADLKSDLESATWYAAWYKEQFELGIEGFTQTGLDEAEQFASEIHGTLSDAADTAKVDGEYIGEGLAEGIDNSASKAEEAAKRMAWRVLNQLKDIPQINSPARIPRGFGRFITKGYALGIEDEADMAEAAATDVADSVLLRMASSFSGTRLPVSYMASGSVIPLTASLHSSASGSDSDLRGILRELLQEFFGTKTSGSTSVTAKVNSRTLFDVLIEEGRQRMRANGRNPFTEMKML